jgi:fructose-1,6-bisphosphatase/sedoheptulose 1,7-bisphosphatase-like protein
MGNQASNSGLNSEDELEFNLDEDEGAEVVTRKLNNSINLLAAAQPEALFSSLSLFC